MAWRLPMPIILYLSHQGSIALPLLSSARIDATALAWTLLIACAATVFFGVVPSVRMSGIHLQESLKDGGHGNSRGRKHDRMRAALVVSEVALACVLLVGAGLLLRSFLRVLDVDLGFEPSHAYAMKIDFDDGGKAARRGAILRKCCAACARFPASKLLASRTSFLWTAIEAGTHRPRENHIPRRRITTPLSTS